MYVYSLLKNRFLPSVHKKPSRLTSFSQTDNDSEDYSENYIHTRTNLRAGRTLLVFSSPRLM